VRIGVELLHAFFGAKMEDMILMGPRGKHLRGVNFHSAYGIFGFHGLHFFDGKMTV
jgi:hypothetical protein